MAIPEAVRTQLGCRFAVLLPHLNERQRRLALATEARLLGHGGVRWVARIAGVSETTVRRGVWELEAGVGPVPDGRVRAAGGGRKPTEVTDPGLLNALLGLVEPDERGDPQSPLRWTTKSLRHLAEELTRQGHPVSAPTVGRVLEGSRSGRPVGGDEVSIAPGSPASFVPAAKEAAHRNERCTSGQGRRSDGHSAAGPAPRRTGLP
jgi:hypothetical protein